MWPFSLPSPPSATYQKIRPVRKLPPAVGPGGGELGSSYSVTLVIGDRPSGDQGGPPASGGQPDPPVLLGTAGWSHRAPPGEDSAPWSYASLPRPARNKSVFKKIFGKKEGHVWRVAPPSGPPDVGFILVFFNVQGTRLLKRLPAWVEELQIIFMFKRVDKSCVSFQSNLWNHFCHFCIILCSKAKSYISVMNVIIPFVTTMYLIKGPLHHNCWVNQQFLTLNISTSTADYRPKETWLSSCFYLIYVWFGSCYHIVCIGRFSVMPISCFG